MMDYPLMINIAEKIIQFRKEKHLSQTELALKAGISRSFLGRIERMESVPSLNTLRKIENALSLPAMSLTRVYETADPVDPASVENALQHISDYLKKRPVSAEELRLIEKALLAVTEFIIS